jgi:hypothetical protein
MDATPRSAFPADASGSLRGSQGETCARKAEKQAAMMIIS